ncbi:MAG: DUF2236 domain-containing protein [Myxococcales bacterium]|nr:DUF2236 domain-containing protein [Myxococcales bacterium]
MGVVGREQYEACVAWAKSEARGPKVGLHGPGTVTWRVSREPAVFLGGGAAALLQLAHPFVAYGVAEHSRTQTDPVGRFQRTFENVYAIVFGDLEGAVKASRRVRAIHERITGVLAEDAGRWRAGDRYAANDEDALLWVHATLIRTAVEVYERSIGRLSTTEKDRYWNESKRFAALFGLVPGRLPARYSDFVEYFEDTVRSDMIAVTQPAATLAAFLFTPRRPALGPFNHWYRAMTAGLLPETLRRQYRLRFGPVERAAFEASLRAARAGAPMLPRRAREMPAYVEARRRIAGRAQSDRVGRALEGVILRAVRPATPS